MLAGVVLPHLASVQIMEPANFGVEWFQLSSDRDGMFDVEGAEVRETWRSMPPCGPGWRTIRWWSIEVSPAFASDRWWPIEARSFELLDNIAAVLASHDQLTIEVEGYTDSQGDSGYNKKLSQRRAEAVVEYLVTHGIDKARLTERGFGEDKPIDDNATRTAVPTTGAWCSRSSGARRVPAATRSSRRSRTHESHIAALEPHVILKRWRCVLQNDAGTDPESTEATLQGG